MPAVALRVRCGLGMLIDFVPMIVRGLSTGSDSRIHTGGELVNIDIDLECQECYRDIRSESDVVCRECYDSLDALSLHEWLDKLRDHAHRRPDLSVEGLIDNWRWDEAPLVAHKQQTNPSYAKIIEEQERQREDSKAYADARTALQQSRGIDALDGDN